LNAEKKEKVRYTERQRALSQVLHELGVNEYSMDSFMGATERVDKLAVLVDEVGFDMRTADGLVTYAEKILSGLNVDLPEKLI
jgi:hypothetical protein